MPSTPPKNLPTNLYRLAEERLGDTTLDEFIQSRWPGKGWRPISDELFEATGVRVSYQTLRSWYVNRIQITTTVAVP